jgi:hypothetical protein
MPRAAHDESGRGGKCDDLVVVNASVKSTVPTSAKITMPVVRTATRIHALRPVPRSGPSPAWLRRLFADNPQFTSESSVLGLETVA